MEKFVFELSKALVSFTLGLLLTFYAAYIAVDVWNWFIVPATQWPSLSIWTAIGVIFLYSLIGGSRLGTADWIAAKAVTSDPSLVPGVGARIFIMALIYSVLWFTAWLFKVMMT